MELCTSFWFWFIILGSFAVLLWSVFNWGWSLGARNMDFQWEQRVKSLYEKWGRDAVEGSVESKRPYMTPFEDEEPHPGEAFHEECGDR